MKYLALLLIIPFLSATECGKKKKDTNAEEEKTEVVEKNAESIPACIKKIIEEGKKETPSTAPIQVDEYLFNGKKVYLLTAQCCDFFNEVLDENCAKICAPSGGITGAGDGNCPEFNKEAKLVKNIWKEKTE